MERQIVNKRMLRVLWLQLIAAVVIIIFVLLIKYTDNGLYLFLKEKYERYFCDETTINQTINQESEENLQQSIETPVVSSAQTSLELTPMVKTNVKNSFIVPVTGTVTSRFGYREDPFTLKQKKHKGTDIAAPLGTEILAVADGTVSYVGYDENGYGNYFTISHNEHIKTLYGHCSSICVSEGQTIKAGQVIGYVGSTGRSTGNHLHFEIRLDGVPTNAEWYISF